MILIKKLTLLFLVTPKNESTLDIMREYSHEST